MYGFLQTISNDAHIILYTYKHLQAMCTQIHTTAYITLVSYAWKFLLRPCFVFSLSTTLGRSSRKDILWGYCTAKQGHSQRHTSDSSIFSVHENRQNHPLSGVYRNSSEALANYYNFGYSLANNQWGNLTLVQYSIFGVFVLNWMRSNFMYFLIGFYNQLNTKLTCTYANQLDIIQLSCFYAIHI